MRRVRRSARWSTASTAWNPRATGPSPIRAPRSGAGGGTCRRSCSTPVHVPSGRRCTSSDTPTARIEPQREPMSSAGTIVVAGSVAQRPGNGGHTWVFLQYLLGLRKLGWEVLFLDRLEPEMGIDAEGRPARVEDSWNIAYLDRVFSGFGLGNRYAVFFDGGRRTVGLERAQVLEQVSQAALVLNVNGFFEDEEVLSRAQLRVFLDIDPGFAHMWRALG